MISNECISVKTVHNTHHTFQFILMYYPSCEEYAVIVSCFNPTGKPHYVNLPIWHNATFHGPRNDIFQWNLMAISYFVPNRDCEYSLELPRSVSTIYVFEPK